MAWLINTTATPVLTIGGVNYSANFVEFRASDASVLGTGFVTTQGNLTLAELPGQTTLLDYGKATAKETPHIEVEHYPIPDPFTTLGQKAAGEGAAIPSPACIAGAIEDALKPLGIRIRQLPISPERVWQLIQDATTASSNSSLIQTASNSK